MPLVYRNDGQSFSFNGPVKDFAGQQVNPGSLITAVHGTFTVVFTTLNSQTWVIPATVTAVTASCWGGGGGGGASGSPNNYGGAGGGGGGFAQSIITGLTPGNNLTIFVGGGGPGMTQADLISYDHAGTASYVVNQSTVKASPGMGGGSSYGGGQGGGGEGGGSYDSIYGTLPAGFGDNVGTTKYNGGTGGSLGGLVVNGGGGGGGAGDAGAGTGGGSNGTAGAGHSANGGTGGVGDTSGGVNTAGNVYGGGGGAGGYYGGTRYDGKAGGQGRVEIKYTI